MNKILIVFFLLNGLLLQAQERDNKAFKKSANRFYIGTNFAPFFVGLLNGRNFQPEFALYFKQRLTSSNHYFRASYNFRSNRPNTPYYYKYDMTYGDTYRIELNDTTEWVTGTTRNNRLIHFFNVGYEYQFKVGEKRNVSINIGADLIFGMDGSKLYAVNDTLVYKETIIQTSSIVYRELVSETRHSRPIQNRGFYSGFSPMIALGFPIKKRFDLTLEMAFDCVWYGQQYNYSYYRSPSYFNVDYRPSLLLSYRFDENYTRAKKKQ
ncbi:MAG: hypothetical protein R2772_11345 [Chitinophagales bacterium]